MNTLIAGAIVTETHTPSTAEGWMTALFFGGLIVLAAIALVLIFVVDDATRAQGRVMVIGGAAAIVAMAVGGVTFLAHAEKTKSKTDYDALTAVIEDTYDLEATEYIGSEGKRVLSTGERVPDTGVLCEAVNTNSPEYTGITGDGQQISFKVGVRDCRAEDPDVQIVVTKTPGIPLTADQLRRQA